MRLLKIVVLFITVACCSAFALHSNKSTELSSINESTPPGASLQAKALVVLKNKCNVCHLKKNKSVIFNSQNMVKKAKKINRMVFVKKKMPKEDVTLTTQERKDLRLWLDSIGF